MFYACRRRRRGEYGLWNFIAGSLSNASASRGGTRDNERRRRRGVRVCSEERCRILISEELSGGGEGLSGKSKWRELGCPIKI